MCASEGHRLTKSSHSRRKFTTYGGNHKRRGEGIVEVSSTNLVVTPDIRIFHLHAGDGIIQESTKQTLIGAAGLVFCDWNDLVILTRFFRFL